MRLFKKKTQREEKKRVCSAVVAAAGVSERMRGRDKLFEEVNGVPVLARTLLALQKNDNIDEIVVVTREERMADVKKLCFDFSVSKLAAVVPGGKTRVESVYEGVKAVDKDCAYIVIHDGARPFVSQALIDALVKAAHENDSVVPGLPVFDTVKKAKDGYAVSTVDRSALVAVQTPQVFRAELIRAALREGCNNSTGLTDDAAAMERLGVAAKIIDGERFNIKLTTQEDFLWGEFIAGILDGGE